MKLGKDVFADQIRQQILVDHPGLPGPIAPGTFGGTRVHNDLECMSIRAINGVVECDGRQWDQVQTRINYYNTFTQIIGVAAGGNLGC